MNMLIPMATNPKMMNKMSEANRQSPNIIRQLNVLLLVLFLLITMMRLKLTEIGIVFPLAFPRLVLVSVIDLATIDSGDVPRIKSHQAKSANHG